MRTILASALAAGLFAGAAQPAPVFTVGVLRRDAIIVPIATYNGKEWQQHWPSPSDGGVSVPMDLASVPKGWWGPTGPLQSWQIWAGPKPETVQVRQPDWMQTYCQKQIGLRTTYQPREWPPSANAQPYPKDGLAVWPPQPVEPIERLAPDSPEGKAVLGALPVAYARLEHDAVQHAVQDGADVTPEEQELERLPITLEALYAYGTPSRRVYWIESSRQYTSGDKNACAAVLFGSGWIVMESGKVLNAGFSVQMVPCERNTLVYLLPLGVIKLPTGTYWIGQWSGWMGDEYIITDISSKDLDPVLAVRGGHC